MLVAHLFGAGFALTALTTRPAESTLLYLIAFGLCNNMIGHQPFFMGIAAFLGALCATIFGKAFEWQGGDILNVRWAALTTVYVLQLASPTTMLWSLSGNLLELSLFPQREQYMLKSIAQIALLVVCGVFAPPPEVQAQQVFCCLPIVLICYLAVHGKATWTTIKNVWP